MRRLQPAAGLRNNVDRAFDGKTMAGLADERFQRGAGQERHHEVRLLLAVLFEFPDIENLNDVGMAHGGEHVALFVEQLERGWVGNIENCFDRNFPAHNGIVGAVNQSHAALAEDLPDLIAACQFSG